MGRGRGVDGRPFAFFTHLKSVWSKAPLSSPSYPRNILVPLGFLFYPDFSLYRLFSSPSLDLRPM